ncbi:N-acetylmuramoyl-L-alanine amidase-like domain-containing protein [Ignavibacterium sp.]|uniref:N-acetylmuramoyl-L-alanine amidase-like domain-containing protein n=1 Tax=Ignavibacterium sp. TaxID=2651167 RepID=UPI00307D8F19
MKSIAILNTLLIYIILLFSTTISAQVFSDEDISECNNKFSFAIEKKLSEKPIGEIISVLGKSFINTPYEAHTLEVTDNEQLIINFSGLDCTTFLETTFALARCVKKNKTSFEDFKNELQFIRYRDGMLGDYTSRLHYFSDWIYNNLKKGIIDDITKEIGGKPIKFKVNFMSENPQYYKHLKSNPDYIPVIKNQESEINSRQYYYISESDIEKIESKIKDGDFIALTTSDKGLDIGHVGIAGKMESGRIHFLHAPQVGSKVQITDIPLAEYVKKIKKYTGILVLRVREI